VAPARNVVVVGASAGGVEALSQFVGALPASIPAAVLVVLHISSTGTSVLPGILGRTSLLPAESARDGEKPQEGRIYVAVPDRHLELEEGRMRVGPGPRENGHRPAVDPLFRSAARSFGSHAVAVVLSGTRDDGTVGAAAVRAAGGRVLVQDPADALYPGMPRSVLERVGADAADPPARLAALLADWLQASVAVEGMSGGAEDGRFEAATTHEAGEPGASGLTCPECGGAIYLDAPDGAPRLSCHTGHAYSPDSFVSEQERELETALWSAVRRLDERAAALDRLADQLSLGRPRSHAHFRALAREAAGQAQVIRDLIAERAPQPELEPEAEPT
jgi:two-component system, chemotaxis family, protein-glutamate methylesterase/glutaminase